MVYMAIKGQNNSHIVSKKFKQDGSVDYMVTKILICRDGGVEIFCQNKELIMDFVIYFPGLECIPNRQ